MIKFISRRPFLVVVFLLVTVLGFSQFSQTPPVKAGALTSLSTTVASATKSASTTYTVNFTNATKIPKNSGQINIAFQGPGSDFNFNNAAIATGTTTGVSILYRNWNGVTLTTSADIAASTAIVVKLSSVTNPSKGGYYFAHIWTSDYSTALDGSYDWNGNYTSTYFAIGTNTNLTGKITDSNGVAVPFTNVYLYNGSYSNYYYTYTDVNGNYGIGDITADSYTFSIYGPYSSDGQSYFPPSNTTVTIASSGVTTKNASFLATTKTLSGKITKNTSSGAAVTDASISVWKVGGNGWASTSTDSSGNFSIKLTGGTWSYSVWPKTWPADWTYANSYENISFVEDSTSESKTKNITVESLTSTITGSIQKPDGTVPGQWSVGLSLSNSKNQWFSAQMGTDGSFTAKVTPGTYTLSGWVSDNAMSFPKVDNFSVDDNTTKNLGVITLIAKNDSINVTVKDNTGAGVPSAWVSAWRNDGTYDWGNCQTASDGTCTIKVTPGTWQVSAWPQWKEGGYDYVNSTTPVSVKVTSGVAASQAFTFQKASATINGTIVDPSNNVISTLNSWVNANDGSGTWSNIGTSVSNGTFKLKVPAGTWDVNVYIYGGDYGTADPIKVTIADSETKSVTIQTVKNDAIISGTVYFDKVDSANKVTGKWMSVWATKGKFGIWQSANFDQSNATYSIKVSKGTWNLGYWIDQSLGYSSGSGQDVKIDIGAGETKTYDIILKKADSKITGKAKKSDGTAMQWAWITADSRDPNEKREANTYYYSNGASSNITGDYTLNLPAGTYFVGANMWPGSGYINPKRQKVTIDANNPATVDLTFRQSDATISGTVKKGGDGVQAYVSAYSEDGGYSEANSNNQGTYSLAVSSGTKWHISSIKEIDQAVWKSTEKVIDLTGSTSASQDLELLKQTYNLPQTVTLTFDPSKQMSLKLDDGTTITAPANCISTSATSVSITATPTASLAQQSDAKPLNYGYDLKITDQNGTAITKFVCNVTIEFKYLTATIGDNNQVLDENELNGAYYDEATGSWRTVDNCTVNSDNDTVTCQVDHFTKFAIVSASDTTSPGPVTGLAGTALDGKVSLSWTNPSDGDFSSVNIYRSTDVNTLGDKVHSATTGTSQEDSSLTNGTTYYYIVKAVDKSGNESSNNTQISATPKDSSLPKTGRPQSQTDQTIGLILLTSLVIFSLTKLRLRNI